MKLINTAKRFLKDTNQSALMAVETREGIANHSSLVNRKLEELINAVKYQTEIMSELNNNIKAQQVGSEVAAITQPALNSIQAPPDQVVSFEEAMRQHPLLFAPKTYNTNHPDYDANVVRNFPGKIFNLDKKSGNPVYNELKKMAHHGEISDNKWTSILQDTLDEVKTVPHADQLFQRKAYIESYLETLETRYSAFYRPGWVNLNDAIFLYWTVRLLKPKVIVQTGVCNGLSAAFMMLALAKNGPEGTLHAIDIPPVFNSNDEAWKVKGKVYGVTIPEGKTSGWLVPDAYQDRFELLQGDAKLLLPDLLKKLGKIDLFYHDSDHTYDHMIFEFSEAKKYLTEHGAIVSDDISWNASLWDFADQYHVPAYNYKGSMGVACF